MHAFVCKPIPTTISCFICQQEILSCLGIEEKKNLDGEQCSVFHFKNLVTLSMGWKWVEARINILVYILCAIALTLIEYHVTYHFAFLKKVL